MTIPSTRSCRTFPSWKRRTCATPHLHREVWLPGKIRCKHDREHQWIRCSHSAWILCVARFYEVALWIESEESMQIKKKPLLDRERERKRRKRKILWSVLQNWCQRKVDGTVLGVILLRLTRNLTWKSLSENFVLMDEISENIFNQELDKLFMVKIQFREDYIWTSTSWRSRIWNEEVQNMRWLSRNESLDLKDYNHWKIFTGQIKFNVSHAGHEILNPFV